MRHPLRNVSENFLSSAGYLRKQLRCPWRLEGKKEILQRWWHANYFNEMASTVSSKVVYKDHVRTLACTFFSRSKQKKSTKADVILLKIQLNRIWLDHQDATVHWNLQVSHPRSLLPQSVLRCTACTALPFSGEVCVCVLLKMSLTAHTSMRQSNGAPPVNTLRCRHEKRLQNPTTLKVLRLAGTATGSCAVRRHTFPHLWNSILN